MQPKRLNIIHRGDCSKSLLSHSNFPDNSVDLIVTSPPYADRRKNTYGGVHPDKYVEWFLPISKQLQRVLKHRGSLILNIKENVKNFERQTYVLEMIIALKKQGWFWIEEYCWYKKIRSQGNGQTDLGIAGKDAYILRKKSILICIKTL